MWKLAATVFLLAQSSFAQKEIPMSTDKGNIVLLYNDIIASGSFSTLFGSIRNDTPNELTSLDFEVVAYDQTGADVRMCDRSNTGLKCEFHILTAVQSGESLRIDPLVGTFHPNRVIPKKQRITRVEWRVVAAKFTPIPVEPTLSFTPGEGDIVVWDINFGSRMGALAFLSFRLVNQTPFKGSDSAPGLSSMVRIALRADGSCDGKPMQWISDSNWLRPHNFKHYDNFWKTNSAIAASDTCEVNFFSGTLVLDADSAMADSYKLSLPFHIDVVGEKLNSNALIFHVKDRIPQILAKQAADKLAADKAQAEQEARRAIEAEKQRVEAEEQRAAAEEQAAIDRKKAVAEVARRKRLAAEQKKKDDERDASLARNRAEQEAAAAEERRKLRANCTLIYQNTIDTKVKDLTIREEQQVRACQVLGLYPPR
uniref:Uncharacterized protein n=1 Tax=Solibacter usitatus (strain Ellin6076) TaxID=234267 RepID=Q022G9_SOLUE